MIGPKLLEFSGKWFGLILDCAIVEEIVLNLDLERDSGHHFIDTVIYWCCQLSLSKECEKELTNVFGRKGNAGV